MHKKYKCKSIFAVLLLKLNQPIVAFNFAVVCLSECDGGRRWAACANTCERSCANYSKMMKCPTICYTGCYSGCECPPDLPVWHRGRCITADQCPGSCLFEWAAIFNRMYPLLIVTGNPNVIREEPCRRPSCREWTQSINQSINF